MFHVEHPLKARLTPGFLMSAKIFFHGDKQRQRENLIGKSPHGRPTIIMSFLVFPFRRSALAKCLNSKSLDTYCSPKPGVAPKQHQCAKTLLGKTTKWDHNKCSAYTL